MISKTGEEEEKTENTAKRIRQHVLRPEGD